LIDGGKHLDGAGILASDLQHLATTLAVPEGVHCSTGYVHQCAGLAHVSLSIAKKLRLAAQYVERFVPVVAVRRRARALITPLQRNSIALRRSVGGQHGYLCADHVERPCAPIGR
jgi:hypothetical protein